MNQWPRLTQADGDAWGYIPGQSVAHYFNRWYMVEPRSTRPTAVAYETQSACSRVERRPENVFLADPSIRRCSHCVRTLRAHSPQVSEVAGDGPVWAWSSGSTRIHKWHFRLIAGGRWISLCGVWRVPGQLTIPDSVEADDPELYCQKCLSYE